MHQLVGKQFCNIASDIRSGAFLLNLIFLCILQNDQTVWERLLAFGTWLVGEAVMSIRIQCTLVVAAWQSDSLVDTASDCAAEFNDSIV